MARVCKDGSMSPSSDSSDLDPFSSASTRRKSSISSSGIDGRLLLLVRNLISGDIFFQWFSKLLSNYRPKTKNIESGLTILRVRKKHVFVITPRLWRILMEHIGIKNSLDSKLEAFSICPIRILYILEVRAKTSFS